MDRAIDACAEAAWCGNEELKVRLFGHDALAFTPLLAATKAPSYTAPIRRTRRRNKFVTRIRMIAALACVSLGLSACARDGEIDATGGVSVTRSACPAIAVPAHTGDVTLFDPPASRDSRAIDVVAQVTNVRSTCNEAGSDVITTVNFDVQARRNSTVGTKEVVLPYFTTIVRGGRVIVSKSVSRVAVRFNDGEARATAQGTGTATISKAAASLPEDVRERITRKRKPGDADAAVDPLSDPAVREAVQRASFEVLVGFQLTQEQLQYNATR
jgi:hypothetical protein